VALHPRNDELQGDVDRVLRQRNALLKQAGGRLTDEVALTLDVWDAKLVKSGEALADARRELVASLAPVLGEAYDQVASQSAHVDIRYEPTWRESGLAAALAEGRKDDLRRGVSLIGPHRDDVSLSLAGLPSRTHASQGEQRSLALALRLATHHVIAEQTGTAPVLLLDDVFSELDPDRSHALLAHLPPGQTILTTAGHLPEGASADSVLTVSAGTITAGGSLG
jgi:DNA replication and repair protein RecF